MDQKASSLAMKEFLLDAKALEDYDWNIVDIRLGTSSPASVNDISKETDTHFARMELLGDPEDYSPEQLGFAISMLERVTNPSAKDKLSRPHPPTARLFGSPLDHEILAPGGESDPLSCCMDDARDRPRVKTKREMARLRPKTPEAELHPVRERLRAKLKKKQMKL
jgi:hypothetical protein